MDPNDIHRCDPMLLQMLHHGVFSASVTDILCAKMAGFVRNSKRDPGMLLLTSKGYCRARRLDDAELVATEMFDELREILDPLTDHQLYLVKIKLIPDIQNKRRGVRITPPKPKE